MKYTNNEGNGTTTERNIRSKANRRGFTLSKYNGSIMTKYALKEWGGRRLNDCPIYDAHLFEIEAFLNNKQTLKKTQ